MKALFTILFVCFSVFILSTSFEYSSVDNPYLDLYEKEIKELESQLHTLKTTIESNNDIAASKTSILNEIYSTRKQLKATDFWLRYLSPLAYKKINAPLPIEWEVEVFEKYEAPYKREGAGLTLAETYILEDGEDMADLSKLIEASIENIAPYFADSIYPNVLDHNHFFLANRLYLLNLAAIYTTGFECPNSENILPELKTMLSATNKIYKAYNASFLTYPISSAYLKLYNETILFVESASNDIKQFNHFNFISHYINPLFAYNQQMIRTYKIRSNNFNDYSLSDDVNSIFDKQLYQGQATKGVFASVKDEAILNEIKLIGKTLFFDPILSGNNKRSCASCHSPNQFFTDSVMITHSHFNQKESLPRNTPSLINSIYNHLLMADGKHFNLHSQAKGVMLDPTEMGSKEDDLIEKVMSCKDYKKAFQKFSKYTHTDDKISMNHIASALSIFFSDLSQYEAPFDLAVNNSGEILSNEAIEGFNLYMNKAQCATCHFVPQFNGVKPPYVGSEFEVIGVPSDTSFSALSADDGRFKTHPVAEMKNAFRTTTLRNSMHTQPYMHNGVFTTMDEVIDFYNNGGGVGHGLNVPNQTLPSDSLNLSDYEKQALKAFLSSLTENVEQISPPESLPESSNKELNNRVIGGLY
ncbi:MAG: cytochrome c peroxidase [Chitinophagales bacterium]